MSSLRISKVHFTAARPEQVEHGMVGHVSLVLNGALKLDGITLRKTRAGKAVLSFPSRRDRGGVDHPYVRPLSSESRAQIEFQVFEALGIEGGAR